MFRSTPLLFLTLTVALVVDDSESLQRAPVLIRVGNGPVAILN